MYNGEYGIVPIDSKGETFYPKEKGNSATWDSGGYVNADDALNKLLTLVYDYRTLVNYNTMQYKSKHLV